MPLRPAPSPRIRDALASCHARGRAAHPPLDVDRERHDADVLLRTRAWSPAAGDLLAGVLHTLLAEDLYLAVACELRAPGAWERLRARLRPRLLAWMRARRVGRGAAEDAVDEGLASLALPAPKASDRSRLGRYSGRGALFVFLTTLTWRRHVDARRREARHGNVRGEALEAVSAPRAPVEATDVEGREEVDRVVTAVRAGLAACTAGERLALVLKFGDGVAQREIAEWMGIGAPRVSRLVAQGLARVRSHLPAWAATLPDAHRAQLVARLRDELARQATLERPTSRPPARRRPHDG